MKKTINLGTVLLIISIILYFLMELPFNLSVRCGNVNEGYYFGYGKCFLEGSHLYRDIYAARGPLFILFYALVVKIFGFGGYSIIAVHFLHSITVSLIAVAIYLTSKKIFQDSFYSSLAVLFWVLIQLSPIGIWGGELEYESSFSFEAEYFCVLFSLISIYFLFSAHPGLSFFSGLLTTCSMMFKGSGAVLVIAVFCYLIYLFLFQNKIFKELKLNFTYYFIGFFISLTISFLALYIHNGELSSFFDKYCALGSYANFTDIIILFPKVIIGFMFKYVLSFSNFILFLFAFIFFIQGFLKPSSPFFPLICIWGIGNVFAIIAPGQYSSYYYVLVWPSIAMSLAYGFKKLLTYPRFINSKIFKLATTLVIFLFFIERFYITLPAYVFDMEKREINLNLFYQPESFQDPVGISKKTNKKRPRFLRAADKINGYLPNKKDTLYVFNFVKGHQDFSPYIYIYAKRMPSSTVYSDWLHVEKLVDKSMKALVKDLIKKPPKIIIIPEKIFPQYHLGRNVAPFFDDLNVFLERKYHLIDSFSYKPTKEENKKNILVFERNNV